MRENDDLLRPEEVAEKLGIERRTVIRWLREGKLACINLGKLKRVKAADFATFLAAHRDPGQL